MAKKIIFVFALLWASAPVFLSARHIIGGTITYKCLGEGDYEFTLYIYRDCGCTGCAQLDPFAFIAIYRCGSTTPCDRLNQSNFVARLNVPLQSTTPVSRPDYPCLIPPNICVEQGRYVFRLSQYNIRLPLSTDSYHISYQRCCRNLTVNNLISPGDVGATYTIEITPEAQAKCNNSPVFNQFPPTVICANNPLKFDHSATDPDGDQLVYAFCSPLAGGGPAIQAPTFGGCAGAYPNPACPPPYREVNFVQPLYTPVAPMGGDPIIQIDPNTGIITGTPKLLGQYVVGVCLYEYDKVTGKLLSKVFRDFQFNVANCDPTVVADIKENKIISDKEFEVNSCGVTDIKFVNESFQRQFISKFEWRFNIGGQVKTFNEWEPTVTFPGVGNYKGQLILNPGTDCGDTANIQVKIFPDITAGFDFEYDTCVSGPVYFTDKSRSGSGEIVDWAWDFGDGAKGKGKQTQHIYRKPGKIPVTLTVRDTNLCSASTTRDVPYFPVPALIVVAPNSFQGCTPGNIFFKNLSFPIDETYTINWDFGDGGKSGLISPTHVYEKPGLYSVSLSLISPIGCKTDTLFKDLINIYQAPLSDFSFAPKEVSNLAPKVQFEEKSERSIAWYWDFGNGMFSRERNPAYTFPDTGMFKVTLIVTHPSGCTDTSSQFIDVKPLVTYHLPNAFTPNEDSVNDFFKGVGILPGIRNFRFQIWNRWGEMIYAAEDPSIGWNGRKFNNGQEAPPGVYVVLVSFTGPRGDPYEYKGFVTLIR